jgi:hypothetical protein
MPPGRTARARANLYERVQWHPPGRRFWITDAMMTTTGKRGEPRPWFSTHTVATVFIGRSAAWLRVRMRSTEEFRDSELVLDGVPLDIHRSATGDRQFSLADIERTAHALRESGSIDDERFICMIMQVVWVARQYGLLGDEGL